MNIFIINSIAPTVWGGGEKWMLTTAVGLRERGHTIYFCGQPDSLFLKNATDAGFVTYPLHIKSDVGLPNILRLAKFFRRKKIDVIITNFNKDVRLAGLAKRLAGVKRLVARNGLPILPDKWIYRKTYRWFADGMITNTQAIRYRYLSYGWLPQDFVCVIHNGIDTEQCEPVDRNALRSELGLPVASKVVGFVGRLVPQKEPFLFIEVAERILREIPDIRFLMVGEGPLRNEIERHLAEKNISSQFHLTGQRNDAMRLYQALDLLLLTSHKEGLPNVILEAMLCALPVVAFDVGGVRELIPDDSCGRVIPFGETEPMVEQAIEILKNNDLAEKTGTAAGARIRSEFSVQTMIKAVERVLSTK